MSAPSITFEDAVSIVGTLPPLHPRPSGTNLRACTLDLIDKLSGMPSHQSSDHGYSGIAIYALTSPTTPWVDWPDPGPNRTIDAALDAAGQAEALVQYNAYKKVYDFQENVRRAVINALNAAVPQAYRRVAGRGVGVRNYRPTDIPTDILAGLHRMYGRLTPTEERAWKLDGAPSITNAIVSTLPAGRHINA